MHAANSRWTVHDVTNDPTLLDGNKGQQRSAIGSQRIDDVAFLVLAERTMIHVVNARDVSRFFRSNSDHVADCPPRSKRSSARPTVIVPAAGGPKMMTRVIS